MVSCFIAACCVPCPCAHLVLSWRALFAALAAQGAPSFSALRTHLPQAFRLCSIERGWFLFWNNKIRLLPKPVICSSEGHFYLGLRGPSLSLFTALEAVRMFIGSGLCWVPLICKLPLNAFLPVYQLARELTHIVKSQSSYSEKACCSHLYDNFFLFKSQWDLHWTHFTSDTTFVSLPGHFLALLRTWHSCKALRWVILKSSEALINWSSVPSLWGQ